MKKRIIKPGIVYVFKGFIEGDSNPYFKVGCTTKKDIRKRLSFWKNKHCIEFEIFGYKEARDKFKQETNLIKTLISNSDFWIPGNGFIETELFYNCEEEVLSFLQK